MTSETTRIESVLIEAYAQASTERDQARRQRDYAIDVLRSIVNTYGASRCRNAARSALHRLGASE
jgi:hypothetical protein